jgi:Ca2+/Na+ antiporter
MKNVEEKAEEFMDEMEKKVIDDEKTKGTDSLKGIAKHREGMSKRHIVAKDVTLELQPIVGKENKGTDKEAQGVDKKQTSEEIDEEDNDEEEIPDQIKLLPEDKQQAAIIKMSLKIMGTGTLLVILFSDPMVGILSAFGGLIGVNPFYVSFILAPLASNGSELLAAYTYALKKTQETITISYSSLQGAACMNNTFCLAIFLILICSNTALTWKFSAETTVIILIQIIMVFVSCQKRQSIMLMILVCLLYPLSIVMVAGLEACGWD